MAKQVLNNLESAGTVRTKVNGNFTELYDGLAAKVDKVDGYALSENNLSDALKGNYDTAYSHSQTTHLDATKVKMTELGGFAVLMINKTGATSVKGTVVAVSATTDNGCAIADTSADDVLGVIYNSGIADGSPVWVVVGGIAEVLIENATAANLRAYVSMSTTVAGRVNAAGIAASTLDIGSCIKAVVAGTDVLATVMLKR